MAVRLLLVCLYIMLHPKLAYPHRMWPDLFLATTCCEHPHSRDQIVHIWKMFRHCKAHTNGDNAFDL